MTKREITARAMAQVALEYSCEPEVFLSEEIVITTAAINPGRREYRPVAPFFSIAGFGRGAVITADKRIHGSVREILAAEAEPVSGHFLFEQRLASKFESLCRIFGKTLVGTFHMHLPDPDYNCGASATADIKWFEQDEITPFYGAEQKLFPNALLPAPDFRRPDMLAVAAYDGTRIIAMAGASADTPDMWQIGIEVLPEYRGRGLAKHLVVLLKDEILRRGKLPFYGTSLSNLGSQNTARAAGFFPAWIELGTAEPRWENTEED